MIAHARGQIAPPARSALPALQENFVQTLFTHLVNSCRRKFIGWTTAFISPTFWIISHRSISHYCRSLCINSVAYIELQDPNYLLNLTKVRNADVSLRNSSRPSRYFIWRAKAYHQRNKFDNNIQFVLGFSLNFISFDYRFNSFRTESSFPFPLKEFPYTLLGLHGFVHRYFYTSTNIFRRSTSTIAQYVET
jgi:hypothetical protein